MKAKVTAELISSKKVQRFFYYKSWTLYPIQVVEAVLRDYKQIRWHYVYYDFDNISEILLFVPFWRLPIKGWLKRWGWGKRLLDRINARQMKSSG